MPLSISDLPAEVLLQIALDIRRPIHRLHLALCSHAFSDIFLPIVFHDIQLNDPHAKILIPLVQTLLRNPHFASCTQTLGIHEWSTELNYEGNSYDPPETLPLPNSELVFDQDLTHDAVQRLFAASDERALSKFMAHLSAANEDAWIGLLLFSLPNLKELIMSVPYGCFFPRILAERVAIRFPPFDSQPALTRLSHVFAKWYDSENSLESAVLEPFFFFPSMGKVSGEQISHCSPEEEEEADAFEELKIVDNGRIAYSKDKPTTSTVTEIDMSRSSTNNGMIDQIKVCKNLRSFRFEHADSFEYGSSFLPKDFARSLTHVRHSLESLWLSYDDYYSNGQIYQADDETFGSMDDYPVLKSVYISAEHLIGSDVLLNSDNNNHSNLENSQRLARMLPASIQSLTLANVSKRHYLGVLKQLKNLVEPLNLSQYTPRLSVLKIQGVFSRIYEPNQPGITVTLDGPGPVIPPEILDPAEALRDLCAGVGIGFELVDTHTLWFRGLGKTWNG
ncbi:conserved hypothetical protein [Histoplasma capsulatum G186AR]|uniref:Leucine-rich repeat domain-containing protein n=2 Tax=Ajellomyces capsulatus TaxID=5037 RepID=C0NZE0_AJECG|nr:uncharacterized protein HCBG_08520 [Histoplasma capsulatum G186AR]EEH03188.1 conserved hypothetical protein [Histoplasma capsulatum G186AR]KAG5290409.1 hypothetical protein I7I52_07419 [Histoplasma capsulatum]QSS72336.1 hypothetical protein I7I50_00150 [Histoplasma capsulatum G186AR]